MKCKQRLFKILSPIINKLSTRKILIMPNDIKPAVSIYTLSAIKNNGDEISFNQYKNKKILIVNTASECGYTPQYEGLEKLYEKNRDKLIILAFPSNEFGKQEPGTDADIAEFCTKNYGVSFPVFTKSNVKKSDTQNVIFDWLTHAQKNGWNEQEPDWNFNKYLIDETGVLTHYFSSGVTPDSEELLTAINF